LCCACRSARWPPRWPDGPAFCRWRPPETTCGRYHASSACKSTSSCTLFHSISYARQPRCGGNRKNPARLIQNPTKSDPALWLFARKCARKPQKNLNPEPTTVDKLDRIECAGRPLIPSPLACGTPDTATTGCQQTRRRRTAQGFQDSPVTGASQ